MGIEYFSEQAAKSQAGGYKPVATYGATKLGFAYKCHRGTVSLPTLSLVRYVFRCRLETYRSVPKYRDGLYLIISVERSVYYGTEWYQGGFYGISGGEALSSSRFYFVASRYMRAMSAVSASAVLESAGCYGKVPAALLGIAVLQVHAHPIYHTAFEHSQNQYACSVKKNVMVEKEDNEWLIYRSRPSKTPNDRSPNDRPLKLNGPRRLPTHEPSYIFFFR